MAGTFISISMLVYASKDKRHMQKITYGVMIYLVIRNSIRILDFEETKDKFIHPERWYLVVAV
jgi:hypothetical protein